VWETGLVPPEREDDRELLGRRVLAAGRVDGPPQRPWRREHRYPLAFDINAADGIAAVSFAILDMHPDIEPGWWCEAVTFAFRDGQWSYAGGDSDNCTAPDPFSRPAKATNSIHPWCDWHSNSGLAEWPEDDPPKSRHTFFGIAPTGTARLTVTDDAERTRDLHITPWNGAYVAIVAGTRSTLTGYDEHGNVLGTFMPQDGPDERGIPETSPGWGRVDDTGASVVVERLEPS
jgi:hypothetical protein